MHAGTIVVLLLVAIAASLWLLFRIAAFVISPSQRNGQTIARYYDRQRVSDSLFSVGIASGIVAIFFTVFGALVLIAYGVSSYSCGLLAEDLSMTYDYSWIRNCRVEVTLEDGREVWINPTNVRLTEDFRLIVTEPQP